VEVTVMATDTTQPKSNLLPWLAANRTMAGTGLMVAGAAIAVLPVLLATWYGTEFVMTVVFTGLLAFVVLSIGVSVRFLPAEAENDPDRLLGLVLALGGLGGLLIALTGLALLAHWWTYLTDFLSRGTREGAAQVLVALVVFLAGLIVMFVTLQLGRTEERRNPTVRRLMYGYNAAFGGVLLLLILAVANVMIGMKVAWAVDSTSTGEFSLSDRTVNLVKGLEKPLHAYVIWPMDEPDRFPAIRSLMGNLQDRSPQVQVEYVSPNLDFDKLAELRRKYPRKIESLGVLLVYGEEKPENATFLKDSDLFEEGFQSTPTRFRGEDKIVAALSSLEGGGQKSVIYFTQGLGEPNLTDTNPNPPSGGEAGLGVLRDRLAARGNFDVKPLKLTPADAKVPDDCKVLVVANPRPPVDPKVADAFRKYLGEKNGKAVFLFDVPTNPTGPTLPLTGLEGLLGEYNVEVTTDRVMSIGVIEVRGQLALTDRVISEISPELVQSRTNELANAFAKSIFVLSDVRSVRPARNARPEVQAQPLLTTVEGRDIWLEPNWQADPVQMYRQLQRREPEAVKKLSQDRLPTAVVVTAANKPKLVAFGDVTFLTNPEVSERSGSQNFALFASTLDWLGERPTSIGIEPRNLAVYSMSPTARFSYMVFLPGLLAVVLILGLGLGVWVVRRR
jgi:gliding motility-associatede transport system auxiliary component